MPAMRLDRFLANAGCGTRSEGKQLLKKGMVTVNHAVIRLPEYKVNTDMDSVLCNGKEIRLSGCRYFLLNKPAGYLSATEDRRQPVVLDLLSGEDRKNLFPVGRLDVDTEGLLLLTDDGVLAHELLSPRKHVEKTYYAEIEGIVTGEDVIRFREGLDIGEKKKTLPAKLVLLDHDAQAIPHSRIELTIHEGKFHQVKRMFEAVGKRVVYLKRISMGNLKLDETLQKGEYRSLTAEEIEGLKRNAEK